MLSSASAKPRCLTTTQHNGVPIAGPTDGELTLFPETSSAEPYQFDETVVPGLAIAIDCAAGLEGQTHHGIPVAALAQLGAVAPPSLEGAMHALFFHDLQLVGHDDPEQITVRVRGDNSGPVDPYPGPVSTATDDEVELWTALSAAVRHPLPKSLLHDLLFLRRAGDVGAHAHDAIELYRQL
jgi:hypothetical protein